MNVKLLAVAVVAIVCVSAVGLYFVTVDNGDEEGPIQIVDGSGKTITLDEPLTGIIVAGSHGLKAMKMLGLTEEVKGISYYGNSSDSTGWPVYSPMFPNAEHMPIIPSMTSEGIIEVCRYILCPVSSMTVLAAKQVEYENMGIKVIRLDFNGDTALEDLDKLTKLFGETEAVKTALNVYVTLYNSVVSTVMTKVAAAGDTSEDSFLYMIAGGKNWFYNQTAAGSKMAEAVYGYNALRNITGLDTSGVSNDAELTNIREVVVQEDSRNSIDMIFIRGGTGTTTVAKAESEWTKSPLGYKDPTNIGYSDLSAIGSNSSGKIFIFNGDLMAGALGYVGYVLLAEACGIDTGYNVTQLITEFNNLYGLNETATGYMFGITIVSNVASATEIVVS